MEQSQITNPILDLIDRPAFCVKDGVVTQANLAARQKQIAVGTQISALLRNDLQAYNEMGNGCLAVTVHCGSDEYLTSVTHTDEYDVFRIEQDLVSPELKALSVAAQHIRVPLATAMTVCDEIFTQMDECPNSQAAQLNRALFQMHRLICNISDTARYSEIPPIQMQTVNLTAVFDEVFEKATAILQSTGVRVQYTGLDTPVYCLADSEKLSRAVYNILSNAVKFAPTGSKIEAKLVRNGNMLHFTVQDEGPGIPREIMANVFSRFLRQPMIEDGRNGIGLGIPLIHAVATMHGGTVLIDHPDGHGTRFTMTLQIRNSDFTTLRTPVLPVGDYAGGRDIALLELSEVLPTEAYQNIN